MNADIKPLLTLRQRLEATLKHEGLDLPRAAHTTVRVGDLREALKNGDIWKQRALTAGYTPESSEFYASVTHMRETSPPLHLDAGYAPTGISDARPYKVRQLIEGISHHVGTFPTQTEAFECLMACVICANKEI